MMPAAAADGLRALGRKVVVVTGAGGFIGRTVIAPLLERGYTVHAIVGRAATGGSPPTDASLPRVADAADGAHTHWLDLFDTAAVRALLETVQPSHLLHFAWVATPGVYWQSPDNERWLRASEQLLEDFRAVGGARVVMAGTGAEYDWSRVGVCDERDGPLADELGAPATAYVRGKLALQRSLARVTAEHELSSAWGRVFFQYGPGEHRERLVASVITRLLAERAAPCTHGRQIRSFLHVADVGSAFAALLDSTVQGPVNIGSDRPIRIAELLGEVARQIGRPELLQLGALTAPAAEPELLLPRIERLRAEVGWHPRFELAAGLADSIAWWRQQPC